MLMNISEQEFKFMIESMTSDLIQLLIDRRHYTLQQATEATYASRTYAALLRPQTQLYYQSPGYVFSLLVNELSAATS